MQDKIISIAHTLFNAPISAESKIGNPPQWDSLGHLNLFMEIEHSLGVNCSPDEIITHDTIASITTLIRSKLPS